MIFFNKQNDILPLTRLLTFSINIMICLIFFFYILYTFYTLDTPIQIGKVEKRKT